MLFLRELQEKVPATQEIILVDNACYLKVTLGRLNHRFQICRRGNHNAVERVLER